ncbi:hypothetical protein [uncultured Roseobacter sp.]|uniref:hypothetical protein n=1 Tax=uncultured Roseobacter sp. TaxID=114847 RepID=UPI002635700E|nr:hypothetical protein [uncultured Roseobacter sp.]
MLIKRGTAAAVIWLASTLAVQSSPVHWVVEGEVRDSSNQTIGTVSGSFNVRRTAFNRFSDKQEVSNANINFNGQQFTYGVIQPFVRGRVLATFAEKKQSDYRDAPLLSFLLNPRSAAVYNDKFDSSPFDTSGITIPLVNVTNDFLPQSSLRLGVGFDGSPGPIDEYSAAFQSSGTSAFALGTISSTPVIPKNIIVVTHGWQPGEDRANGLPEISRAIEQKTRDLGLNSSETLVIEYKWDEAVTPLAGKLIFDNYFAAQAQTAIAGARLQEELQKIVVDARQLTNNPTFDPQIHFIGHSLGTMVNAEAINRLVGVTVEQVTMLDTPLEPGQQVNDHSDFFYNKLPLGSVQYVENFFVKSPLDGLKFGQPISGTGPCQKSTVGVFCNGVGIADVGHSSIASEFYPSLVSDDLNGSEGLEWNSPILSTWSPDIQWDPLEAADNKTLPKLRKTNINNRSTRFYSVEGLANEVAPGSGEFRLVTQSPAILGADVNFAELDKYLSFDYMFESSASSLFELYVDDSLLWSMISDYEMPGVWQQALVPISYFSGQDRELRWELNPLGFQGASVQLRQISVFIPEANLVAAVPLPASALQLLLALFGLVSFGSFTQKRSLNWCRHPENKLKQVLAK